MHDHNLDDLIIDNIEPQNSKTKSFLTIIALLIVMLIVAIILTKVLLKSPNDNGLAFEQDSTEMIAPELKLQETPRVTKAKKEPSLSDIIEKELKAPVVETKKPVITEKPTVVIKEEKTKPELKPEEVLKVVKAKKEPSLSNIIEQEIKAPVVETKKSVTIEDPTVVTKEEKTKKAVKETVQTTKEYTQVPQRVEKPVKTIEDSKPKKVETPVVKKPKPVAKTAQEIIVPKPIKKPVITATAPKTVSTKRYYVQVGSFKKAPSARFISVIRNTGFKHKITRATANGTKKLLIGPYKDRASVDRALIRVRDRINKRAFVVKK